MAGAEAAFTRQALIAELPFFLRAQTVAKRRVYVWIEDWRASHLSRQIMFKGGWRAWTLWRLRFFLRALSVNRSTGPLLQSLARVPAMTRPSVRAPSSAQDSGWITALSVASKGLPSSSAPKEWPAGTMVWHPALEKGVVVPAVASREALAGRRPRLNVRFGAETHVMDVESLDLLLPIEDLSFIFDHLNPGASAAEHASFELEVLRRKQVTLKENGRKERFVLGRDVAFSLSARAHRVFDLMDLAALTSTAMHYGALTPRRLEEERLIQQAFTDLQQNGSEYGTLQQQAARRIWEKRDKLTFEDLEKIVHRLAVGPTLDTVTAEWLALALQRRWDGISAKRRDELENRLQEAGRAGVLPIPLTIALRRPIASSLSPAETETTPDLSEAELWKTRPAERLGQLRRAVRALQRELQQPFVSFKLVSQWLGVSCEALYKLLKKSDIASSVLLSIDPRNLSVTLLTAVSLALRRQAGAPVLLHDICSVLEVDLESLRAWAKRTLRGVTFAVLAKEFGIYPLYSLLGGKRGEDPTSLSGTIPVEFYDLDRMKAPYVEHGLNQYLKTHGLVLNAFKSVPTDRERHVIRSLLESLVRQARPTSAAGFPQSGDFVHHVSVGDYSFSLMAFYDRMGELNKSGYSTPVYIAMRYEFIPRLPPLEELQTLDQWKTALAIGALEDVPWPRVNPFMKVRLILELARQRQKPIHWLLDEDFALPLEGFARPGGVFSLRTLASTFRQQNKSKFPAIFALLNSLRMLGPKPVRYLPLTGLNDLQIALERGWAIVGALPWDLISPDMQRAMVIDLAGDRDIAFLSAASLTEDPAPSLEYRDPVTGTRRSFTLRGLYKRYYDASRSTRYGGTAYMLTRLWPKTFKLRLQGKRLLIDRKNTSRPLAMRSNGLLARRYKGLTDWQEKHDLVRFQVPNDPGEMEPFTDFIEAALAAFGRVRRSARRDPQRVRALLALVLGKDRALAFERFLSIHPEVLFEGDFWELADRPDLVPLAREAFDFLADAVIAELSRVSGPWTRGALRPALHITMKLAHTAWNDKHHRRGLAAMRSSSRMPARRFLQAAV
jgi:hypothetical protein